MQKKLKLVFLSENANTPLPSQADRCLENSIQSIDNVV